MVRLFRFRLHLGTGALASLSDVGEDPFGILGKSLKLLLEQHAAIVAGEIIVVAEGEVAFRMYLLVKLQVLMLMACGMELQEQAAAEIAEVWLSE